MSEPNFTAEQLERMVSDIQCCTAPWLTDDNYTMRLFDEMVTAIGWDHTTEVVWRNEAITADYRTDFPIKRRRAIVLAYLKWRGKI